MYHSTVELLCWLEPFSQWNLPQKPVSVSASLEIQIWNSYLPGLPWRIRVDSVPGVCPVVINLHCNKCFISLTKKNKNMDIQDVNPKDKPSTNFILSLFFSSLTMSPECLGFPATNVTDTTSPCNMIQILVLSSGWKQCDLSAEPWGAHILPVCTPDKPAVWHHQSFCSEASCQILLQT